MKRSKFSGEIKIKNQRFRIRISTSNTAKITKNNKTIAKRSFLRVKYKGAETIQIQLNDKSNTRCQLDANTSKLKKISMGDKFYLLNLKMKDLLNFKICNSKVRNLKIYPFYPNKHCDPKIEHIKQMY